MTDGSRPDPLLQVLVDHWNGVARIRVAGELDLASREHFERALSAAESYGRTAVVLNLENLVFMDSTGLSAILSALKRAEDSGRTLQVHGARDEIQRILAISGLHWLLEGAASTAPDSSGEARDWEPIPVPDGEPDG
jgi:anti-sigma B factor antagonist